MNLRDQSTNTTLSLDKGKPGENQRRKTIGTTVQMHYVSQLPKDQGVS